MQCFSSKGQGPAYMIVLDRGELLLEGIEEAVRQSGIENGLITGGIGSLTRCNCHVIASTGIPPTNHDISATGAIELASVQGTVVNGEPHVHIIAWNYDTKETYVGHLDPGSEVCYRAEIGIQAIEGQKITRIYEDNGMIWIRPITE